MTKRRRRKAVPIPPDRRYPDNAWRVTMRPAAAGARLGKRATRRLLREWFGG